MQLAESSCRRQHRGGAVHLALLTCWLTSALSGVAQTQRITGVELDPQGRVVIRHQAATENYYILYWGLAVTGIQTPLEVALGSGATGTFTVPRPSPQA